MLSTEDMTKEERVQYWEMVIEEFNESGLTKTDYCRNNDIPVSTFNYWENRLKEMAQEKEMEGSRFVELPAPADERRHPASPIPGRCAGDFYPELAVMYEGVDIFLNSDTPLPLLSAVLEEIGYVK